MNILPVIGNSLVLESVQARIHDPNPIIRPRQKQIHRKFGRKPPEASEGPIICRIADDELPLDSKTISEREFAYIMETLASC